MGSWAFPNEPFFIKQQKCAYLWSIVGAIGAPAAEFTPSANRDGIMRGLAEAGIPSRQYFTMHASNCRVVSPNR
jgi:hypothetical protein